MITKMTKLRKGKKKLNNEKYVKIMEYEEKKNNKDDMLMTKNDHEYNEIKGRK